MNLPQPRNDVTCSLIAIIHKKQLQTNFETILSNLEQIVYMKNRKYACETHFSAQRDKNR